jgi:hypothetical protein
MSDRLPVLHSGFSFADMQRLAESIARSGLFGVKNPDQALALMAISQAEGRHPALAARDYDIIQGRPAKKAEAMQRDFIAAGGKIEWHKLSDTEAEATFSHPAGGTVRIGWDKARAQAAGISGKDNWKKFPRAMLRARCVSEGVRTVYPMATSGMYVPEEVSEFAPREPIDVTPHDPETGEIDTLTILKQQGEGHAALGSDELREWYTGLDRAEKKLIKPYLDETLKQAAIVADNKSLEGALEPDPVEDDFGLPPIDSELKLCEEIVDKVAKCTIKAGIENIVESYAVQIESLSTGHKLALTAKIDELTAALSHNLN